MIDTIVAFQSGDHDNIYGLETTVWYTVNILDENKLYYWRDQNCDHCSAEM